MSKSVIILFGIYLLLTSYCYSQSDLFDDYFPSEIKKNKNYMSMVQNTLNIYAEVNPQLIYYYLQHLRLKFENNIINPNDNFLHILTNELEYSKQARSRWVDLELDNFRRQGNNSRLINNVMEDFFDEYQVNIQKPIQSNKSNLDFNLSNYFSYVYIYNKFKGDFDFGNLPKAVEFEAYNPALTYQGLINDLAGLLLSKYERHYELLVLDSVGENVDFLKKVLAYSYLIFDYYSFGLSTSSNIQFSEFLDKIYSNYFLSSDQFQIRVSATSFIVSFKNKLQFSEPNLISQKVVDFKHKAFSSFNLGLQYRYTLKNTYDTFSHVSLNFSVSRFSFIYSTPNNPILYEGGFSSLGNLFRGVIKIKTDEVSFYSYASYISTPIFFITRDHFFEIGLAFTYSKLKTKYVLEIDGELIVTNPPFPISELGETNSITVNNTESKFYPFINYNYRFLDNFVFSTNLYLPTAVNIGFGFCIDI